MFLIYETYLGYRSCQYYDSQMSRYITLGCGLFGNGLHKVNRYNKSIHRILTFQNDASGCEWTFEARAFLVLDLSCRHWQVVRLLPTGRL